MMAAMTSSERTSPSTTAGEREMLDGWLEFHRETLVAKCEGLSDEQLRTASAEPSMLSLLGLVRHMADVERHWFRRVLTGQELESFFYSEEDPDGDFRVGSQDTWQDTLTAWQAEVAAARDAAAGRSLDDLAVRENRKGGKFNLRWIYVHMIEEYARHNGHADLLRERIDGATGV